MNYEYKYNCVNPPSLDELEVIIDDLLDDVPYETFSKVIPFNDINDALGRCYSSEEQISKDWAIRFFIGSVEFEDETINYAVVLWSAIEFVFKC